MAISGRAFSTLFTTFIFYSLTVKSQDIHFSQFTQSPLTINPALAGTTVWIRAALIGRDQWRAVHSNNSNNTFTTMGASFDVKSKKRWIKDARKTEQYRQSGDNGFGWGVNIYNDRAGDGHMGTLSANASLAYQIMTGAKSMIALGMQGGIMQRSINFNDLNWGTQYDPNSATGYNPSLPADKTVAGGNNSILLPDFGTGIVYTYKKNERYMRGNDQMDLTIGAAIFHVAAPLYSFLGTSERLYRRYVLHATSTIGISNTSVALVPAFLMQNQGPNLEILAGSMVRYMLREDSKYTGYIKGASVSAGAYYRNNDAVVIAGLFEFSSYGIGVSYDLNVSGLKTVSSGRGGFEISLRFLNPAPFLFSQASFSN